ncbi:glutamate ionotropic kainate 1 [Lasius niger]|uniref:Glutamate ionotropic kainate 1 n=1 Tax=Lasius niger TaxID=67767 RepID=A0A0J7KR17_LASNI|nr:glutamate ionotropic kainate 1 [Lasius niger]
MNSLSNLVFQWRKFPWENEERKSPERGKEKKEGEGRAAGDGGGGGDGGRGRRRGEPEPEMAARWLLLLLALLAAHAAALPDFIRIGGLFHPSDDKQEVAFRYAAEKINANRDILPKSRLSAQVEVIQPQDSFHASKRGEFHN